MPKLIGLVGDIPPRLQRADEVLHAYGRWAMDRFRKQRCASAEGMYRIPPGDADREPREILLPTPEAMEVHRALIRVPDLQRTVLHILYVPKRLPPEAQLRMLRIPARLCQQRHLDGLRMFDNLWRIVHSSPIT